MQNFLDIFGSEHLEEALDDPGATPRGRRFKKGGKGKGPAFSTYIGESPPPLPTLDDEGYPQVNASLPFGSWSLLWSWGPSCISIFVLSSMALVWVGSYLLESERLARAWRTGEFSRAAPFLDAEGVLLVPVQVADLRLSTLFYGRVIGGILVDFMTEKAEGGDLAAAPKSQVVCFGSTSVLLMEKQKTQANSDSARQPLYLPSSPPVIALRLDLAARISEFLENVESEMLENGLAGKGFSPAFGSCSVARHGGEETSFSHIAVQREMQYLEERGEEDTELDEGFMDFLGFGEDEQEKSKTNNLPPRPLSKREAEFDLPSFLPLPLNFKNIVTCIGPDSEKILFLQESKSLSSSLHQAKGDWGRIAADFRGPDLFDHAEL